jgi:hypothetical protein
MSAKLSELIPDLQPFARDLLRAAGAAGLMPRITSTRRTYAEQKRLYDRYLAGASEYPAAPPGHSAHEYGYALDMIVSPLSALADVGDWWRQQGGLWGPGDAVHFEYPGFQDDYGSAIAEAQTLDDTSKSLDPLGKVKDVILSFAGVPGELIGGLGIGESLGFTTPQWLHLVANPSEAVHKYPWLRLLGPPFIFYDEPLF